ncbi:MAG: helix-turn-helix transcriptional regulator [bacterium]|nr:helix-turn-helix transcriptional regulator [bacterium]MDE0289246.1 helix-turn-helix transcriptional regulator [bacterium]MDE0438106.1 helix-turn-helix transcriptional regulator [bacterium]
MAKKRIPTELEAVYVISVAASLAGMHPQTLRIYERRGLIEPFRTPGGTRRYSDADLERLSLIQDLTSQGINIEGVKRIMQLESENEALRTEVRRLRRQLKALEEAATVAIQEARRSRRTEILVRRDAMGLPDLSG